MDSRYVMSILLEDILGYTNLTMFNDSEDLVQRLAGFHSIDVIFLDVNVGPDDGFVVLDSLRRHEDFRQTKVIAVTASFLPDELQRIKLAGFDGLIAKPLDDEKFPDQVARILRGERVWEIG